ncbi:MAG: Translation initiation factor, partial [Cyanobacteriota bacterium]
MTSSGKVRIYELSRDLGLENKDVLDAAEKLGVAVKSHSSSISDDEAARIRNLIEKGGNGAKAAPPSPAPAKAILSVKKTTAAAAPAAKAPAPMAPPAKPAAPS